MTAWRVGIDIGGTFTDAALVDGETGQVRVVKVLTTPDDPARGFSFRQPGPLDMRMDQTQGQTLADWLASVRESELADVIHQFGEERHARRVAAAIIRARDEGKLSDTAALASVVRRAAGGGRWQRIDPATREQFLPLRHGVDRLGRNAAAAGQVQHRACREMRADQVFGNVPQQVGKPQRHAPFPAMPRGRKEAAHVSRTVSPSGRQARPG